MIKYIELTLILIFTIIFNTYSQPDSLLKKPKFLSFQTGFIGDNYNSAGIRFKIEYSKQFKKKWYYGIFIDSKYDQFEHTRYDIDENSNLKPTIPANTYILSSRFGYHLSFWKDRISWNFGLGAGLAYLNWTNDYQFMPIFNADLTLNIRITKKFYIETAPLIILLPVSTFYYSFFNYDRYTDYYGITMFPIGLKYKF